MPSASKRWFLFDSSIGFHRLQEYAGTDLCLVQRQRVASRIREMSAATVQLAIDLGSNQPDLTERLEATLSVSRNTLLATLMRSSVKASFPGFSNLASVQET